MEKWRGEELVALGDDMARENWVAKAKSKLTTTRRGKGGSQKQKVNWRRVLSSPRPSPISFSFLFLILNFGDGISLSRMRRQICFYFTLPFSNSRRQIVWQPFGRHVFEFEFKSGDGFVIAVLSPFYSINNLLIVVHRSIFWKLKNLKRLVSYLFFFI